MKKEQRQRGDGEGLDDSQAESRVEENGSYSQGLLGTPARSRKSGTAGWIRQEEQKMKGWRGEKDKVQQRGKTFLSRDGSEDRMMMKSVTGTLTGERESREKLTWMPPPFMANRRHCQSLTDSRAKLRALLKGRRLSKRNRRSIPEILTKMSPSLGTSSHPCVPPRCQHS